MKFYKEINNLINNLDFKNLNFNIINKNSKKIYEFKNKLFNIWNDHQIDNLNFELLDNKKNEEIKNIFSNSILNKYSYINNLIKNNFKIYNFQLNKINFYYFDINNNINNDIKKIIFMFNITYTLNKYFNQNNSNILIIWLPVTKNRDFNYNIINNENLKNCEKNFEAFTCSGVTFNKNPRITIITRYEEVEKLLIHEIIHNIGLDGSFYHNKFIDLINDFKLLKGDNFDYQYSIYESYTELLSTYFMILFNNININNKKEFINKVRNQIILELIYSYNVIINLIKINNLELNKNSSDIIYEGNICFYEYYYLKGLMYNNYILEFGNDEKSFFDIYTNIINMLKKIKINDDNLLVEINKKYFKNNNFKYTISN
jgi:hypothetical protein